MGPRLQVQNSIALGNGATADSNDTIAFPSTMTSGPKVVISGTPNTSAGSILVRVGGVTYKIPFY